MAFFITFCSFFFKTLRAPTNVEAQSLRMWHVLLPVKHRNQCRALRKAVVSNDLTTSIRTVVVTLQVNKHSHCFSTLLSRMTSYGPA